MASSSSDCEPEISGWMEIEDGRNRDRVGVEDGRNNGGRVGVEAVGLAVRLAVGRLTLSSRHGT